MSRPIKANNNTIELTVHISSFCVLDLLCVNYKVNFLRIGLNSMSNRKHILNGKIPLLWLNFSKDSYKKYKEIMSQRPIKGVRTYLPCLRSIL